MIKTSELMIGNLIEYNGEYVKVIAIDDGGAKVRNNDDSWSYCLESEINPIPLTDKVMKRLGIVLIIPFDSVHQYQNWGLVNKRPILDITPLLAPRYTTHDGVEVWEGDEVWKCKIENPKHLWVHIINKKSYDEHYTFSTQQACQAYIDSVTRKLVFTTMDGVNIFEEDLFVLVKKSGYCDNGEKSTPFTYRCFRNYRKKDECAYFSTTELAQKYLNKVWADKEYNDLLNKK